MASAKKVLIVGIQPELLDFTAPEYDVFPGLTTDKVMEGLNSNAASLVASGYEATLCLTDLGDTAEAVLQHALQSTQYDCVVIGAGIRMVPTHFLLFEKIINAVHTHAAHAKICFNTKPSDTAEAVKRWI